MNSQFRRDEKANQYAEVIDILRDAQARREQILKNIKSIRPDDPYKLDFRPPGSPPTRPLGSAAQEKKQYQEQLEKLKDDTSKTLEEKSKNDPSLQPEELALAYDAVFYPNKNKDERAKERNSHSKDMSTSQDYTSKVVAESKFEPSSPPYLASLFSNPNSPSIESTEEITDITPPALGEE